MKKQIFYFLLTLTSLSTNAQELLLNGGFEDPTSPWTDWYYTIANGNLWGGQGSCTAGEGTDYIWLGDQFQNTGINTGEEDNYQTVTIPGNADSCQLTFISSINTLETEATSYDFLDVEIYSSAGTLLYSLGYLDNTFGDYGIPGCQSWYSYNVSIPSQFFGQSIRLSFKFTTDVSYPTIFRLDDVSLISYATICSYSLSQSSYTCPDNSSNTYFAIAAVNTQSSCSWNALVTSGSSWLTCTSSGSGNGAIDVSASQNTGITSRTGSINVEGQTLTIIQPGIICNYNLSQTTFTCPDSSSNNYNAVAAMSVLSGCTWSAVVTSGGSWLTCTSAGDGNGNIDITVGQNTSVYSRTGTISVGGQNLIIIQPGIGGCIYSLSQSTYSCSDNSSNTYNAVATIYAQTNCTWDASVSSGGSWLTCTSAGSGNGDINISVSQNTGIASRTGSIMVAGQVITIIQPGIICTYSLSQTSYTCPDNLANTYNSVSTLVTLTGCAWDAMVTSGGSWLTCTSSGTASGSIDITVSLNTSVNARTGTINVEGQNLTINQPGISCTYILSQNTYTCPGSNANTYNAIATMNTQPGCTWSSVVISGGGWLNCTSSGSGNGNIGITVSQNSSINSRTGTISIQGQILTVIQPGADCAYTFSQSSYSCPTSNANTYDNIALVNTQSGCIWNAYVSSGNSWLATSASGSGSGSMSIIVLENTGITPRTGTISVDTEILTVIQPAHGTGIEELNPEFIAIFPNPAYESIRIIANPQLLNHIFEFIDIDGKILRTGKISDQSMIISLTQLPEGVYVFRLPEFNKVFRVIKL